jgi:glycosyltransferase involved in cell wall biosynthesis
MACGLSVVATNSGANSEIINKIGGGFVVNNDIEWYDSIRMLILDQDLRFSNKLDLPNKIENYYSVSSVINIWQNNISQII